MLLQSLYLTGLAEAAPVKVVPLHGDGSYMGYNFCGNFTGVPEAAGQKVSERACGPGMHASRCPWAPCTHSCASMGALRAYGACTARPGVARRERAEGRVCVHLRCARPRAGHRPGPHDQAQARHVLTADDAGLAVHPPGPPLLSHETGPSQGALGRPGLVSVTGASAQLLCGRAGGGTGGGAGPCGERWRLRFRGAALSSGG